MYVLYGTPYSLPTQGFHVPSVSGNRPAAMPVNYRRSSARIFGGKASFNLPGCPLKSSGDCRAIAPKCFRLMPVRLPDRRQKSRV
jgi:hypothetical protein